jgi:hypothetical protein
VLSHRPLGGSKSDDLEADPWTLERLRRAMKVGDEVAELSVVEQALAGLSRSTAT